MASITIKHLLYYTETEKWPKNTFWRSASSQHVESSVGRMEKDLDRWRHPPSRRKLHPRRQRDMVLCNVFVSDNRGFDEFRSWQWLVLGAKRNLFAWIWSNNIKYIVFRGQKWSTCTMQATSKSSFRNDLLQLGRWNRRQLSQTGGHRWVETGTCDRNGWFCWFVQFSIQLTVLLVRFQLAAKLALCYDGADGIAFHVWSQQRFVSMGIPQRLPFQSGKWWTVGFGVSKFGTMLTPPGWQIPMTIGQAARWPWWNLCEAGGLLREVFHGCNQLLHRISTYSFMVIRVSQFLLYFHFHWILMNFVCKGLMSHVPIQSPDTSPLLGIHAPSPRRPNSELVTITSDTLPICHPWAL